MTDTNTQPETVADVIAALKPLVSARRDGIGYIAAELLCDMEFSAEHKWLDGFPTMDSRVTPREQQTFSSSAAKIRFMLTTFDRIKGLEALVAQLASAIEREVNAEAEYTRTPADRGGQNGPKGLARQRWFDARAEMVAAMKGAQR